MRPWWISRRRATHLRNALKHLLTLEQVGTFSKVTEIDRAQQALDHTTTMAQDYACYNASETIRGLEGKYETYLEEELPFVVRLDGQGMKNYLPTSCPKHSCIILVVLCCL